MRKLSIVLLLIGISFITIEANTLSEHRAKRLVIKRWHQHRGVPVPIPIEAILYENTIEVRFLENVDKQVIFQGVIIPPNGQETYKINLTGYKTGHYELLYIEEDMTLVGEFEIEHSMP